MKNLSILILVVSLLITFSLKLYAEEVTKIEIILYSDDGTERTIIGTNSLSENLLIDSFKPKKQSKYYLSTGIGKIKGDVVASFLAGYKLLPNLSIEGGLITSAEVYTLDTDSTSESGTTDGKSYTIDANAGLKATTNTSYLLGVNYSIPVFSNRPNTVPFPKLMPNLQINNNNLELYSKAGILFWGVDYSLFLDGTIIFDGVTYTPNGSIPFANGKGSNFYYGIGLSYPLTNEAAIRTEYTKSKIAGVKIGGFSSSIVFEF